MRHRRIAAGLLLLAASITAPAQPTAECPADGSALPLEGLYGNWTARIDGMPGTGRVRLDKHPDYAGVKGTISRTKPQGGTSVAQLAGDIDDEGLLNIDESQDGRSISGVWIGELDPKSCGRSFKGTWRNAADDSAHPFTLDKTGNDDGGSATTDGTNRAAQRTKP